jgi:hypothetical protein
MRPVLRTETNRRHPARRRSLRDGADDQCGEHEAAENNQINDRDVHPGLLACG